MPIKTVHITNAYHPTSGGISTFYRALLNAANRQGRPMRLIAPSSESRVEEFGEFGRIYYLAAPAAPFLDRRYRMLTPRTYLPFFNGELPRILQDEQPDLIEVCDKYSVSWVAGLARRGWFKGIQRPALVGMSCERMDDNVRAFVTDRPMGKSLSQIYLGNLYLPLFDYHIANSRYTAEELRGAMRPRHERPIYVRPMGVDVEEHSSAHRKEESRRRLLARCQADERARLLLYVGRISPEKNIPLLIEMMERLANDEDQDYRLLAVGSGPLSEWLKRELARRTPGRTLSFDHISERAALIDLYANCDAFVHPNPREPFGIAPLEAMAARLPLVAPNSGGVLSYADETNAWLAEPEAGAFAATVRNLFSDPAKLKDKLARARWTAQQHSWTNVTAQFFDLYDELHADFPKTRFARQDRETREITKTREIFAKSD